MLDPKALYAAQRHAFELDIDIEDVAGLITAYLEAAPSGQTPIAEVKGLEWNSGVEIHNGQTVWAALAGEMGFTYSIWTCSGDDAVAPFHCPNIHNGFFDTLEAAKAGCQSDFETRIRSALLAPPKSELAEDVEDYLDCIRELDFAVKTLAEQFPRGSTMPALAAFRIGAAREQANTILKRAEEAAPSRLFIGREP